VERKIKTGYVIFETVRSGMLTPGYEAITVFTHKGETFEAVFEAVYPKEYVYKGVFESRNDARRWVDNWKPEEAAC
jgi:hypothetical protein